MSGAACKKAGNEASFAVLSPRTSLKLNRETLLSFGTNLMRCIRKDPLKADLSYGKSASAAQMITVKGREQSALILSRRHLFKYQNEIFKYFRFKCVRDSSKILEN